MNILDIMNNAIEISKELSKKEPVWGYNNIHYIGKVLQDGIELAMRKIFEVSDLQINRYDTWHYSKGKSNEVKFNISIKYEGEVLTIGDIVFQTSILKMPYSKVALKDSVIVYYDNAFTKDVDLVKKHLLDVKNKNTFVTTKESIRSLCQYIEHRLDNNEPIIVENVKDIRKLIETYNNSCSTRDKITKDIK